MNKVEYLLTKVAEEAGEVSQIAMKCMQFGTDEVYQLIGKSNAERLREEFNDVYAVMQMLVAEGVIQNPLIDKDYIKAKKLKVKKYMGYSQSLGTLDYDTCPTCKGTGFRDGVCDTDSEEMSDEDKKTFKSKYECKTCTGTGLV